MKKIGQGPIFSPTLYVLLILGFHDLADRWNFQTEQAGQRIPGDQQQLHPERRMSEQRKEELDDSKFR